MSNPKTIPEHPPKPVPHNGWVQKCDLDDYLDRHLPIPTQVVSNEEYYPLPQTTEQKAVEYHLLQMATRNAKKLGIDRRHQAARLPEQDQHAARARYSVTSSSRSGRNVDFRRRRTQSGLPSSTSRPTTCSRQVAAPRCELSGVPRTGRTWNPS
jgi:hypothetical protein